MSYQDRRRQASFRGVPFEVRKRGRTGGRRGPTHEHAQRDLPDAEDTGARARGTPVNAFVIGPDYDLARNRLLEALEKPGPGIFVDEWGLGEFKVIVRRFQMNESDNLQGLADFTIEFDEAGDPAFPIAALQTSVAIDDASASFGAAAVQDFAAKYDISGTPNFVSTDILARATEATQSLSRMVGDIPSQADNLQSALSAAADSMASQVRGTLGAAVRDGLSNIADAAFGKVYDLGDPTVAKEAFAKIATDFGSGWPVLSTPTATRVTLGSSVGLVRDLVQRVSLSQEARAVARVVFDSVDQGMNVRDDFFGRLDTIAASAASSFDDNTYNAVGSLRAAVAADITERTGGLPRRRQIGINAAQPSVVLAYRLYGDASRADELQRRNDSFGHPMFSPSVVTYLDET